MGRSPPPRAEATDDDATLFSRLSAWMIAEKTITTPIRWITNDFGDLRFTATLDVQGVTIEGLLLFGRASASVPDVNVTLGLRYVRASIRPDVFDRFDWRPRDAHTNKGIGPDNLRFLLLEGTHRHPLTTNASLDIGLAAAMAGNLPVAEPVLPEPSSWEAFLHVAADCWGINGLVTAPYSIWQYDLLPLTGGEARGIAALFGKQAEAMAERTGIGFDGHAVTATRLRPAQLPGAIMALANAATRALERAMLRAEMRRAPADAERLVARLRAIFPQSHVRQGVKLRGDSTHEWEFDAAITIPRGRAVFDIVTPHPTSIVFTSTKFQDLARLEDAPARLAVVHRKASLGDLLPIVSQAAQVIEDDAPDQAFQAALAA